ncbi:peptidylprolyl isomerase [Dysgonomonas sp. PFB1-18]|uniref:peptidylprolyl isomerase n=2 Tax=unclassified Dysgonomonas TaxID=2630389 RepID=UPI00247BBB8D|nr:peptidylprolyl isomerase [Dysgonomonas sp. PF1-14]MDH6338253.1 peptidylprolyl isomerase [Dysgonomonas sp. PF1-16]MDH6379750.1 peptidylprolyl isomerase [Dysgonomonas sp. PFB1-18]MDH6397160.1 peptidylprolyl isomerase [Dysgonomonas sp. PF1-23]
MKKLFIILPILFITTMCSSKPKEPVVVIQTNYGNIKVKLYNETPIHRDNFLKKAEEGFFKDLTFHRVIKDFMIQGGDPDTRNEADSIKTDSAENKVMGDTIPAEIRFPQLFNKRGALAAARWGDAENPTKASDASQFYIVTGELIFDEKLSAIEKQRFERLKQNIYNKLQSANMDTIKALYKEGNRAGITELRTQWQEQAEREANEQKAETMYSDEQRELYKTRGGAPHLDGEYTVFGEVIEGMDIVDKIQNVKTNEKDKPLSKVVMNIVVLEK